MNHSRKSTPFYMSGILYPIFAKRFYSDRTYLCSIWFLYMIIQPILLWMM